MICGRREGIAMVTAAPSCPAEAGGREMRHGGEDKYTLITETGAFLWGLRGNRYTPKMECEEPVCVCARVCVCVCVTES